MSPGVNSEFEIAALAAASERRNSPARVVVAAAALMVIGAAFAGYSRNGAGVAARSVSRAQAEVQGVESIVKTMGRLEEARNEDWATQYEANPFIRTTLSALAGRASLTPPPTWGDPRNEALQDSPLTRQVIEARLTGVSLEAFLNWITLAQREIDGLEIVALDFTPADQGWTIRCRFGRWEKRE